MKNTYDRFDTVKREKVIVADGGIGSQMKMAAYRVRDPETGEWSKLQYHVTFNNMIIAMMDEESAKLFVRFVQDEK